MEIDISSSNKEDERKAQETPQRNVEFRDPEVKADGTNRSHVSNPSVSLQQKPHNTDDVDDQSTESESEEVVVPKLTREIVSICTTDEEKTDPRDCLPPRGTPPDTKGYVGRAEQVKRSKPQTQATDPPKRKPTPPPRTRIPKKREIPTSNGKTPHVSLTVRNKSFVPYNNNRSKFSAAEKTNKMIISHSQRNLSISEFFDPSRTSCPGPGRPHEYFCLGATYTINSHQNMPVYSEIPSFSGERDYENQP